MTTHGKYCDFNFYVTSLDAENGYAATEPMSSGLSLLEAVSEFYKRCGRYPSSTNIMLGVEYTTGRRDLEPAGKGAAGPAPARKRTSPSFKGLRAVRSAFAGGTYRK